MEAGIGFIRVPLLDYDIEKTYVCDLTAKETPTPTVVYLLIMSVRC